MAPTKTGKSKSATTSAGSTPSAPAKKEKLHHPLSRKANQLARNALRKGKLGNLASKSRKKQNSLVDVYAFFYNSMPEDGSVLSLSDVHVIVRDIWLTRHDEELEEERAARRKGRPKSAKEAKLEEIKAREIDVYRTGMEVIDLTHPANVELFHRWDQKELAFIQLLRFIRIFSTEPDAAVVSRPGKHFSLIEDSNAETGMQIDADEVPLLTDMSAQ